MAITTTSTLPAPVQQSFSYKLLSVPVPNMIHKIPAMKKNMPRNGGTTLRMRRYNPLNTAMVPLGNSGVTPPPQNLTAVDRLYVHYKSSLIDLKLQVAIS
jgi:N4-gp56 family major capsid protein